MADPEDSELVERARRGDAAASEQLVRRYLRAAYAVALGVLRNAADAEDLAQEAFMVALQRLGQCRDPARFAAWLLSGVRNRALHQLAKRRTRSRALDGVAREGEGSTQAPDVVVQRRLLAALDRLTPVQREVVLLHEMESWTHPEIAGALGISEVMSRQHLFVSRRALRAFLGDDSQEGTGHG